MPKSKAPSNQCLIAALGASAGGLEALEKFFKHTPADSGIAFIVVQHLAPDHESALPELLGRHTRMIVEQARDNAGAEPNRVYIIPPNATLTVKNCRLRVAAPVEPRGHRTPIDSLFRSLAEDCGENAVCIMLSGTGTDGTLGLRDIKENGGMAMAQTLDSAKYDAILRSAIATGLVDHVLPVEEMPAKLMEYAAHLSSLNGKPNGMRQQIAAHIGKIHGLLRRRSGHDFSQYKESTIVRRLERRMKALQIETAEQYVQILERQPEEADRLFKDLLIGVTQFFRDPEAFQTLAREVIPKLFEGKGSNSEVRACVVGCASGEEAYSIAILLCEHASTLDNAPRIKIFATDIDERGLEMARKGRYPEGIAEHVSPERLERYFIKQDHAYQIKRELREVCIFSTHSFIKDPPFSRLDLISCRNVMIYLGPDLQRKTVPLFHYALRSGGYLFLGPSESANSHRELFRALDKKHRIFQRKESLPRPVIPYPLGDVSRPMQSAGKPPETEERNFPKQLERIILQRYAPACVIVKENGDAVYFSGRTSRYLEQPAGSPDTNVVNMAREGLRIPLRTALHRAVTAHERAVQKDVSVPMNGGASHIDIAVEPLVEFQNANLYMIIFEDATLGSSPRNGHAPVSNARSEEIIEYLESELRAAQEHAQAAFEELETSNEELKSANEEYQSTNEELETSKEELQSFNEELETVNSEVNRKVAELDHANSDLQNLLDSTQIATIFLDCEFRIKSFTPSAVAMFRLIAGDAGRPITDLAAQFAEANLVEESKEVLRTLSVRERNLTGAQGQHYLMRILPYRTVHHVIDGVVITFTDVTRIRQAEQLAQDAKTYAENIVDTVREPLLVLDADLRVKSANKSFYKMFRVLANGTVNQGLYELGNRQWDIPELLHLLSELKSNTPLEDFEVEHDFEGLGRKTMMLNARRIQQQNSGVPLILLAIEDVTERKLAADALQHSEERYRSLFGSIDEGFCIIEKIEGEQLDFRYVEANPAFSTQSGVSGVVGKTIRQAFPGEPEEWFLTYDAVLRTGEPIRFERGLLTQGRVLELYAFRAKDETGRRVAVIFKDITEQKRSEEALRHSRERYQTLFESAPVAVFVCDSSAVIQDYNRLAEEFWGRAPQRGDPSERFCGSFKLYLPDGALLPHANSPIVEVLRTGIPVKNVEVVIERPDASRIPVLVNFFPLKNELGEITGAITSFVDVTELKRTQEALRSLNLDLKHFSYATSHDLQEPLRMVTSYTQLLAKQYKGKLDQQADQFIAFAVEGAQRMETLLGDLREYWSVGQKLEHPIPVECNRIVEKALDFLKLAIRENGGVVTHDSLPTVMAHEVPLVLLFQNLAGNALKYHRPGEPPLIHISAERSADVWSFSVRDNGIGIEAKHLENIFAPFKRLHGTEYLGSGIGLAICQKIVERYGGRIWAESTYGQGSTFRFTIPA